jgi:phosphoglycerate dehydrogenase-like enzyme
MGRIGSEVARRARAFGMRVLAYDPYLSHARAQALDVEVAAARRGLRRCRLHHRPHADDRRDARHDQRRRHRQDEEGGEAPELRPRAASS